MTERSCGKCKVCCTIMKVEELGKPRGTTCEMLGAEGCSVYNQRPSSCRAFECLWLKGFGSNGHRPDRSNVLVHAEDSPELGNIIVVNETKPGGYRNTKAKQVMKKLRQSGLDLYICHADGSRTLQGSGAFMTKAQALVDRLDEERRSKVRLKVLAS